MNKIKERRLELGLSQVELAKRFGTKMDVGMLSRFENSVCLPMPRTLRQLEVALNTTAKELFSDDDLKIIEQLGGETIQPQVSDDVAALISRLKYDRNNAATRAELSRSLQMSDRRVRELIEQARRAGYIIINDQSGAGYYLSDDPDVWAQQYHQDTARALSILARRKTIRARLKAAGREV